MADRPDEEELKRLRELAEEAQRLRKVAKRLRLKLAKRLDDIQRSMTQSEEARARAADLRARRRKNR